MNKAIFILILACSGVVLGDSHCLSRNFQQIKKTCTCPCKRYMAEIGSPKPQKGHRCSMCKHFRKTKKITFRNQ